MLTLALLAAQGFLVTAHNVMVDVPGIAFARDNLQRLTGEGSP